MIAVYVVAVYILQVGYCILLVFSRNPDTKRALIKGCGFPLMLSNWFMALWAVTWVSSTSRSYYVIHSHLRSKILQAFLLSTICLGILMVLLFYANIVLLIYHQPSTKR